LDMVDWVDRVDWVGDGFLLRHFKGAG
jgi:hypothetical protein